MRNIYLLGSDGKNRIAFSIYGEVVFCDLVQGSNVFTRMRGGKPYPIESLNPEEADKICNLIVVIVANGLKVGGVIGDLKHLKTGDES